MKRNNLFIIIIIITRIIIIIIKENVLIPKSNMGGVNRNARQGRGLTKPFANLKSHVVKINIIVIIINDTIFIFIVEIIFIIDQAVHQPRQQY